MVVGWFFRLLKGRYLDVLPIVACFFTYCPFKGSGKLWNVLMKHHRCQCQLAMHALSVSLTPLASQVSKTQAKLWTITRLSKWHQRGMTSPVSVTPVVHASSVSWYRWNVFRYQTYLMSLYLKLFFDTELIWLHTYLIPNVFNITLTWYRTFFKPNLFYTELIWYQYWTFFIPSLFDTERIWYWTYLIDTEHISYRTYLLLNLFFTKLNWYRTYMILNLSDTYLIRYRTARQWTS